MCLIRTSRWGIASAFSLAAGALGAWSTGHATEATVGATVLYETGFEAWEGFSPNQDLIGQSGWIGAATDLQGREAPAGGNGVLADPIPGFTGQYAYVGFAATNRTADFNVWRPVNLNPVAPPLPFVRFRVSLQIEDSTSAAPHYDDFRWSIYNTEDHRCLSLDFDNDLREVNFILDGLSPEIRPTGFTFENSVPYDLEIDLNLGRNLWTARINGAVIVQAQPITTEGAKLSFGDADAVWVIRTPGQPGDNYMIFDDYRVTVEPLTSIPPTLEPVGMLNTGAFVVRILGEPGVSYQLQGTDNFVDWLPIATGIAQSPGGYVDLQDSAARQFPKRMYRAASQP
ncbi:MAG TPA: hypothetical protein PLX89_07960 [Verrucomicrobiota bacterium]|nr:hypothetical protein [Verrucomicrobiales bacterium]HRI12923.1 hypothetical protein [Verrucomicrobiota bacterium]